MCHRPDILPDLRLVGLEGVPVDEPGVVVFDEHLPLVLRQHAAPDPRRPVVADQPLLLAAAEGVRAGVGGVGQHVVHRVVGRLGPMSRAADVGAGLQRELQALVTQPQPDPAHRPADGEPAEDRGDDTGDGLVGVHQDLPVGLAPDQARLSPRRSSPRAALFRIPPSRRARRICSSISDMVPFMKGEKGGV